MQLPFFSGRKPYPITNPKVKFKRTIPEARPYNPAAQNNNPQNQSVSSNLFTTTLDGQDFIWMGTNRSEFYRYLRDHIPIISSAIWSWVHLCATPQSCQLEGSESEKQKALEILRWLDARVFENPLVRQQGIKQLTELLFLELFTVGSFAAELVLLPDGSGIDYLKTLNPDLIHWEKQGRWKPFWLDERGKKIYLDQDKFFFATLGADITNPKGIEPLASVPFVAQIQEAMLSDMSRSARNAGTPRLQVKIKPPTPFSNETDKEYQGRVNRYFEDTVSQFQRLEADDNIFTWSDVEVAVIGGDTHRNFTWRLNREQVIEDVISGLRLYPWVVGRSHGTTKNWVEAQFNILMQIVDSVQNLGVSLGNYVRNTELRLRGNSCIAEHVFAPNQDPFMLTRMQARAVEFETIDKKVRRGYISKDDGARELGYPKAFQTE